MGQGIAGHGKCHDRGRHRLVKRVIDYDRRGHYEAGLGTR